MSQCPGTQSPEQPRERKGGGTMRRKNVFISHKNVKNVRKLVV